MIPVSKLKAAGVDVAAAIHEAFLNEYAEAHFQHNPTVYTGSSKVTQFADLIKIEYTFGSPATFDIDPIAPTRFRGIWTRHLLKKGGDPAVLRRDGIVPPNLSLCAKSVVFKVTIYEGQDETKERFSVTFDWALRARAAVLLKDLGGGKRAIQLEPIKVAFEQSLATLENDLHKLLSAAAQRDRPSTVNTNAFDPSDPEWCIKVERLILYFINGILETQVANFIRSWELPRAIELMEGLVLQPDFLLLENDLLIVGGQVTSAPVGQSPLQAEIETLLQEFDHRYRAEFEHMSDVSFKAWLPETSPTLDWINERVSHLHQELSRERKSSLTAASQPTAMSPTLSLLTNGDLVDLVAKKYLNVSNSWEGEKKLDRIVKGVVGWWLRVENAKGGIVQGGVSVSATVNVGGKAQVCHFDFDPKNFGDWRCHGPCVNLRPTPNFGIDAFPSFDNTGVYLRAVLTTQGLAVNFCDWPSWANDLLGWATSYLTRPLLDAIRAIIALFRVRVAKYPVHFPGTGLEWQPNMDNRPVNMGDYLVFQAAPDFR